MDHPFCWALSMCTFVLPFCFAMTNEWGKNRKFFYPMKMKRAGTILEVLTLFFHLLKCFIYLPSGHIRPSFEASFSL
uniref:Secreted protein n=1 Tax=Rhizophora mucronata TaxID=61149 RepID=A0A2P2IPX0_RHIMU